jgi:hypothetical protein
MKKFLPILFVLWLFAVFGSFYLVQKPFTPAAAAAILNVLLDLLAASWLGLLGLGLGHRLLLLLHRVKLSNLPTLQPSNPPNFQPQKSSSWAAGWAWVHWAWSRWDWGWSGYFTAGFLSLSAWCSPWSSGPIF